MLGEFKLCFTIPITFYQGYEAQQRTGVYISEDHLKAFEDIGVLFKGPLTIPVK